jgi:hypothetical protein
VNTFREFSLAAHSLMRLTRPMLKDHRQPDDEAIKADQLAAEIVSADI